MLPSRVGEIELSLMCKGADRKTLHPASKDPSASVSEELRHDPGSVRLASYFAKDISD